MALSPLLVALVDLKLSRTSERGSRNLWSGELCPGKNLGLFSYGPVCKQIDQIPLSSWSLHVAKKRCYLTPCKKLIHICPWLYHYNVRQRLGTVTFEKECHPIFPILQQPLHGSAKSAQEWELTFQSDPRTKKPPKETAVKPQPIFSVNRKWTFFFFYKNCCKPLRLGGCLLSSKVSNSWLTWRNCISDPKPTIVYFFNVRLYMSKKRVVGTGQSSKISVPKEDPKRLSGRKNPMWT